jgi:4-amino-4-deoxy-L-arabinose transferase-like glycosyltransferase
VRALLVLGLTVVLAFLGLQLWTTEGHFVAQISDLYVIAQYAKAMAEGHPFQYNAGEAPTTGATSLLHTTVLALAHAAGARGEGLIAFAVVLGAALYLASIPLAVRVGTRLAGPREGLLAGALVALGGPVVWGYLYGSDIALFLFLALLLLDRWLAYAGGGGAGGLAVAGTLVALARPEGLPIALVLGAASARRSGASRRERLLPWLPVAAGLLVLALQRLLTGSWLQTSVGEKALLPNYGPVETVALVSKYAVDVLRGLLLGLYPSEVPIGFSQGQASFFFPPLALAFVLLAAVRPPHELRWAARVWLVLVALVFALAGPNVFMGVHFNRYLMWAFPALLAFTAAGLGVATRLVAGEDDALERGLFRAGAGLFLLLGFVSTARFAAVYSEMAGETWRREIPMADWIRANLPRGVSIANAATSVEYLTGHRNLNLHGVTSPGFVGNRTAEREAGLFESLGRLPEAQRPPFLLVARSGHDGSELMRALAEPPPVHETMSLGDDLLLFRARWDVVGRGESPVLPETLAAVAKLEEVDRLDVCDARDEAAHGYSYHSRRGEMILAGAVAIGPAPGDGATLADAGRLIVGGESFRARTRAGRDLVIVLRSRSPVVATALTARGAVVVPVEVPEMGIVVRAGGREVARLALPNRPGWNEHVFRVAASAVSEKTTDLALSGRYATFHYWFYQ